jgi:hypothetical protein
MWATSGPGYSKGGEDSSNSARKVRRLGRTGFEVALNSARQKVVIR